MADRARVDVVLLDAEGDVRANTALTFFEEDGTTPLAQPIYSAESGGSVITSPTTNGVGTFRGYVTTPQRGQVLPADDSVKAPVDFLPDPVDMILMDQSARRLASVVVGPDTAALVPLAVRGQVGQTAALQEWRSSAGAVLSSIAPDGVAFTGTMTIRGTVTAAKIQAALTAGLSVILPEGNHAIGSTITLPINASIKGQGDRATILTWTGAAGGNVFSYAAGAFTASNVTIADLGIASTVANVTGIRIVNGGFETFANLSFYGIQTHFYISGGFRPAIRNVYAAPLAPNSTGGSYFYGMPHLDINGYTTFQTSTAPAVLTLARVAAATVSHVNLYGPSTKGIILEDDCQGVLVTTSVMTGVTTGVTFRAAAGSSPTFCELLGVRIDQPSVMGVDITAGGQLHLTRCELTNGLAGIAFGPYDPVVIVARLRIHACTFENLQQNGILAVAGAGYFSVTNCTFIGMGTSGSGQPLVIGAGVSADVFVAHNDMMNNPHGSISDGATSGARRRYVDNLYTLAPAITNAVGVTVTNGASVTVDGVELGLGQFDVTYRCQANTSLADEVLFVANRACQVVACREVHATAGTAGGAVNLQLVKDTGTAAPGGGTDLVTNNANAGFDLKGTANTVQTAVLTANVADLQLAAGNRLAVDFNGTLTSLTGVVVTVTLKPI